MMMVSIRQQPRQGRMRCTSEVKRTMLSCCSPSSLLRLLQLAAAVLWVGTLLFVHGGAQGNGTATTDPDEVQALNAIFRKWKISSSRNHYPWNWNTSGDPCSGAALTGQKAYDSMDNTVFNPAIICDCSFDNGSTCHITRLKAFDLGIVGTIPEELSKLKNLNNLQIAQNYLFGPLPAFMGNFSNMEWLSIGKNALSGPIPKELGNLSKLKSLGMGMNNFSGSLPPELGNMISLEQIYTDSIGVTGEIPSTFGNLTRLKFMWSSDNDFGGRVPEFLGNFTNMESMRLQGNSFVGPIPSTLANLTKLNELRLGDLLDGSSSLGFIRNMKSLATLVLRDCRISDTIPSDIGKYTRLTYLDLSFNNLSGTLPESLLNIESLRHLYLGNNSLSGVLPIKKSQSLLDIDLSYNAFTGSLPSWVTDDNMLQLNLVANNLLIDDHSTRNLYCLQRNFPCYRGSPVYYSFAVNCGGDVVVTSDGTHFEADNQNLSTASYFVTSTKRWAVSNVGTFVESQDPKYIEISSSQFRNTAVSEMKLFQTSRLSPSSLRYYGLGLENGNYTITLRFSETAFPNDNSSSSLGKRIFNIYIQGRLAVKDFDIRKEAGGSFIALEKNYTASVTENYLEVHLFWAGKGTCCIPTQGYYGPSISAISINPNFRPHVSNHPPSSNSKHRALIAGLSAAAVALVLLLLAVCIWRQKTRHVYKGEDPELVGVLVKPKSFSYLDMKNATEDFSLANKLGEGGFGPVYKGKLHDGKVVAIKQLSGTSVQGKKQFVAEIAAISAVKHRNLVKLYGCCYEGDHRLLVYEYLENKSLDQALFGKQSLQLNWPARFEICLGTAKGLAYLHEESSVRIVHRDIKASNILLDAELTPKISDFGLAKLYDEKLSHVSTRVAGTTGYLAPEYAMRGHLTEKADVFSFGVVTLEILCGRSNYDQSLVREKAFLLEWAWGLHEEKCDLEMLDPRLESFNKEEAMRMIRVAFLCTQSNLTQRPSMSRVVAMLVGDIEVDEVFVRPAYLTDFQFEDISNPFSSTVDSSFGPGYSSASRSPQTMLVGQGR